MDLDSYFSCSRHEKLCSAKLSKFLKRASTDTQNSRKYPAYHTRRASMDSPDGSWIWIQLTATLSVIISFLASGRNGFLQMAGDISYAKNLLSLAALLPGRSCTADTTSTPEAAFAPAHTPRDERCMDSTSEESDVSYIWFPCRIEK